MCIVLARKFFYNHGEGPSNGDFIQVIKRKSESPVVWVEKLRSGFLNYLRNEKNNTWFNWTNSTCFIDGEHVNSQNKLHASIFRSHVKDLLRKSSCLNSTACYGGSRTELRKIRKAPKVLRKREKRSWNVYLDMDQFVSTLFHCTSLNAVSLFKAS